MNVTGFRIFKLFGTLDHNIELKKGGLTFIHGPNGSGKTTALRLLELALKTNLAEIKDIVFSSIEIDFNDNSTIVIERKHLATNYASLPLEFDDDSAPEDHIDVRISMRRGKKIIHAPIAVIDIDSIANIRAQVYQRPLSVEKLSSGMLVRVAARTWRLSTTGEMLGLQEVADYLVESTIRKSIPIWYLERTQPIPLAAIRAQRLFEFSERESASSDATGEVKQFVSVYSEDIIQRINKTIAKSSVQFQTKEKTFPHRILAGDVKAETEANLRSNYIELQKRLSTLSEIGLQESSDSLTLPAVRLNPTHRRVLTLYLSDMNEKLDIFNEIFEQITVMSSLLNKKLRRKKFSIDRKEGFQLQASGKDSTSLKLTDLSSGEQHQLVILYNLIFSDARNQLYLIDEPEISLHVEWQRQFSDDLRTISNARGHQFIIATHSPQIINGRLDLAVPLDGGIPNE